MSTPPDRRTRKRLATRQGISDAATLLFMERGFDAVTVDDIAEAADVGRMTVFNHFPRKEDLFFDRDEEGRALVRAALRETDVPPVEALRRLAHRTVAERSPVARFFPESRRFVETVERSEALKARARAIRDELAAVVASSMAAAVGRPAADPEARLAADLTLATWTAAFAEAHRAYRRDGDAAGAAALLLSIVDRGMRGVEAALAGTPYAGAGAP